MPIVTSVLGMHHSGTSCLAECLIQAGVRFGDVRRDTREDRAIVRLHASMVDWSTARVPAATSASRKRRDEIIESYGEREWCFKEPLTLFTIGFWREALELRLVGTFRSPRFVVSRLLRSHGGYPSQWERLWVTYNERLLALHNESPFPILCFDDAPDEYEKSLRRALLFLERPEPDAPLFNPSKRHGDALSNLRFSDATEKLYRELKEGRGRSLGTV